jgi:antitoxin CptB
MTDTGTDDGARAMRRKRIAFRAWHRGIRETDLILGRFANAYLAELGEAELGEFERLLELPDPDVLAWVTGTEEIPPDVESGVLRRIVAFNRGTVA